MSHARAWYNRPLPASVTLAVLGLLAAAIYLPNSIESGIAPPDYRFRATFRPLANALESYHAETGVYPDYLWQLTTPTALIPAVPLEVFAPKPHQPPVYARFNAMATSSSARVTCRSWILLGRGPDCVFDIDPARDLPSDEPLTCEQARARLADKTYDATNGSASRGDIFLAGGL